MKINTIFYTVVLTASVGVLIMSFERGKKKESVSYSKDILPIFEMRCFGCHSQHDQWWGDNAIIKEFYLDTYENLMEGGDDGRVIVPYHAEQSELVKYIESNEISIGSHHTRMPFVQRPLGKEEIQLIRDWIDQGAKKDTVVPVKYSLTLPDVSLSESIKNGEEIHIACRIPVECYATLTVRDAATNKIIQKKAGAIQIRDQSEGNLGSATFTDFWLFWHITSYDSIENAQLPAIVSVSLEIENSKDSIWGSEFGIQRTLTRHLPLESSALPNPISLKAGSIVFEYRVDAESDVDIQVGNVNNQSGEFIFSDRKVDIAPGLRKYPWNLKANNKQIDPGDYFVRFRCKTRNTKTPVDDVCIPFKVNP